MEDFNPLTPACSTIMNNKDILLHTNCNIIAINIQTIIRSLLVIEQNQIDITKLINLLRQVIDAAIQYIMKTHMRRKINNINYVIILYNINYGNIPQEFRRKNKSIENIINITNLILSSEYNRQQLQSFIDESNSYIEQFLNNSLNVAFNVQLISNLNTYVKTYNFATLYNEIIHKRRTNKYVLMISHIPLDYHIPSIELIIIDTFTGNYWNRGSLGIKIFKSEFIIFNKVTHLLFGDKHFIKPLLNKKEKKELMNAILHTRKVWREVDYLKWLKKFTKYHILAKLKLINKVL